MILSWLYGNRTVPMVKDERHQFLMVADLFILLSWTAFNIGGYFEKSLNGVSKKTFYLLLLAKTFRYLDIFFDFTHFDNAFWKLAHFTTQQDLFLFIREIMTQRVFYVFLMKWISLAATLSIVVELTLMRKVDYKQKSWADRDWFPWLYFVFFPLFIVGIALYFSPLSNSFFDFTRHFSYCIEIFALLPQLSMGIPNKLNWWFTFHVLSSIFYTLEWLLESGLSASPDFCTPLFSMRVSHLATSVLGAKFIFSFFYRLIFNGVRREQIGLLSLIVGILAIIFGCDSSEYGLLAPFAVTITTTILLILGGSPLFISLSFLINLFYVCRAHTTI